MVTAANRVAVKLKILDKCILSRGVAKIVSLSYYPLVDTNALQRGGKMRRCCAINCKRKVARAGAAFCQGCWDALPTPNRDAVAERWCDPMKASRRSQRSFYMAIIRATVALAIMTDLMTFEEGIEYEREAKHRFNADWRNQSK
jgi:hypothetical protein